MARLYTLVGKTSGRASAALERGEELVALRAAQLATPDDRKARDGAPMLTSIAGGAP